MPVPRFSIKSMKALAETDRYVSFIYKDLRGRNPQATEKEVWTWVYNTYYR